MIKFYTNSNGFTLVETLTAMMILAISLTTILQLFSGGLKSARLSDDYTRAIFHAKEKMEEILLSDQLMEGELKGKFEDNFRWLIKITSSYDENEEDIKKVKPLVNLFNIDIAVMWDAGTSQRKFEINTIHIAKKIQEEPEK